MLFKAQRSNKQQSFIWTSVILIFDPSSNHICCESCPRIIFSLLSFPSNMKNGCSFKELSFLFKNVNTATKGCIKLLQQTSKSFKNTSLGAQGHSLTASNAILPAQLKMDVRGLQNGQWVQERGLSLCYWVLQTTFAKQVFWSEHSLYEKRMRTMRKKIWFLKMENNSEKRGPLTPLPVDRLTATDCNSHRLCQFMSKIFKIPAYHRVGHSLIACTKHCLQCHTTCNTTESNLHLSNFVCIPKHMW